MPHLNRLFQPSQNLPRARLDHRLVGVGLFLALFHLGLPRMAAAEAAPKDFNVPPGDASNTLGQFVAQAGAGERVLYSVPAVAGVQTNGVRGRYTAFKAVDLMVTGTVLEALQVDQTGAIAIRRRAATSLDEGVDSPRSSAPATLRPPTPNPNSDQMADQIVKLNSFEVSATAGQGYVARESTGLKTAVLLEDTPQSMVVMTSDMIRDVGEFTGGIGYALKFGASDVTAVGMSSGDSYISRGSRSTTVLMDGVVDVTGAGPEDSAQLDSINVLKGPNSVLYPTTALSGTVVKVTKKPLNVRRESVELLTGSDNFYRMQFDITGPLAQFKAGNLDFRLIGAIQKFDGWLRPKIDGFDDRQVLFPSLQLNLHDTIIRFQYDYENMWRENYTSTFLVRDANGYTVSPWQGAGKYQTFMAPWGRNFYRRRDARLVLVQRLLPGWEMHLTASYLNDAPNTDETRFSSNPNLALGTATLYEFKAMAWYRTYFVDDDFSGKYRLFGMDQSSTFGYYYQDQVTYLYYPTHPLGTVSIYQPNALAGLGPWSTASMTGLLADITKGTADLFDAYYMHTVYIWPDRLIAVGGVSYEFVRNYTQNYSKLTSTSGPNASSFPYRVGLIFKPFKGISLFGNRATTFSPQTNRDINNSLVGNTQGEVTEAGIRGSLWEDRISGTIDYFSQKQSNLAVLVGQTQAGGTYYTGSGLTTNRGVEMDIAVQPVRGWTTVFTYFSGHLIDQNGNVLADAINHSASVMSKYTIHGGPLKGLSLGGNVYHQARRWNSAANGYGYPAYTETNAFAAYGWRQWRIALTVKNLQNKYFVNGGLLPLTWVDIAQPRSFELSLGFKK